jgi:hypothetical protein
MIMTVQWLSPRALPVALPSMGTAQAKGGTWMNGTRFDGVVAALQTGRSRRGSLRLLIAAAAGVVGAGIAERMAAQDSEEICAVLGRGCSEQLPCCGRWICLPLISNPLVGVCVRKRDLPDEVRDALHAERRAERLAEKEGA